MQATYTPIDERENVRQFVSRNPNNPVIYSPLSEKEAAGFLEHNSSDFAQSLVQAYRNFQLTPEREYWLHRLALEQARRQEAPRAASEGNFSRIVELFQHARKHKKFPKVELHTEDGQAVVLKLAGPRSKYSGCLYVTDGESYPNNRYYGLIDINGLWRKGKDANESVQSLLEAFNEDPAGVAKVQGQTYSHCCFCGLELTQARSLEAGYGPICASYHNLPW